MKLYLVVRVTNLRMVPTTKPVVRRYNAKQDLEKLRREHPATDYRIAELTVPTVAPYSDYWPVSSS